MNFTEKDQKQINEENLTTTQLLNQLETFKSGIPPINLIISATLKNGIISITEEEKEKFISYFDSEKKELKLVKFVPASGAATRMFKKVFNFLEELTSEKKPFQKILDKPKYAEVKQLLENKEKLPFHEKVLENLPTNESKPTDLLYLETLLSTEKLNFGKLPKGLIPFHKHKDSTTSPFIEHFYESAIYAETNGKARLHFTVTEEHLPKFQHAFETQKNQLEQENNCAFEVDYSFQQKSTNTIAVNLDNTPFRHTNNQLVFRPAGHGALLQNLNKVEADIIFIKNIDNVVKRKFLPEIANYKKMLAGFLLQTQHEIFQLLTELDKDGFSEELADKARKFVKNKFGFIKQFNSAEAIKNHLNKPIRICGMVKNEGAPGGGPFWIKGEDGKISLQIVESAQMDLNNPKQAEIQEKATHFNPVDLVCGIKNYKGEKFDLNEFSAPEQGFISEKSIDGKKIKALELPGLWNGAMAKWNTIFVEVPSHTFNPVKTVNDLLKPSHQR
ncbi:DUF4301 family protein [Mesonia maritima]|uniref:DUF4301 domain-containing protein n=1 Tax=Mesonia maritima TaxID=1793873 RepID=A0ABU1K1Q9_9FLAO|nr:DUF4301 family protein [Mesonia maritima]MDR6299536.1 hypothetical protein [Mesonia maritima]